jgi:Tfp pilus assembly protein PilF
MLHARKKEWDIALADLAIAVKLEPENRQFINTYGFALCRNGKFEESYKVFIKINEPAKAHYQVARMMEHVGKKEEAREHLIKALANQPDFPDAKEMLTSLGQ